MNFQESQVKSFETHSTLNALTMWRSYYVARERTLFCSAENVKIWVFAQIVTAPHHAQSCSLFDLRSGLGLVNLKKLDLRFLEIQGKPRMCKQATKHPDRNGARNSGSPFNFQESQVKSFETFFSLENAGFTDNGNKSNGKNDNIGQTNHTVESANFNDEQLKKLESRLKLLEKENSELKKNEQLYNATVDKMSTKAVDYESLKTMVGRMAREIKQVQALLSSNQENSEGEKEDEPDDEEDGFPPGIRSPPSEKTRLLLGLWHCHHS
eukprot:sb/3468244/